MRKQTSKIENGEVYKMLMDETFRAKEEAYNQQRCYQLEFVTQFWINNWDIYVFDLDLVWRDLSMWQLF